MSSCRPDEGYTQAHKRIAPPQSVLHFRTLRHETCDVPPLPFCPSDCSVARRPDRLADIRTAGEWKSTGVIPGSKLLTFFDEKGNANSAQWLASAKGLATPDQPVILICRSGNRTRAATQFLSEQAGYKTVYNVSSGVNGWLSEKRTLVPATPAMTCSPGAPC